VTTRSYAQFESGIGVQGPLLADGGLEVTGQAQVDRLRVPGLLDVTGAFELKGPFTAMGALTAAGPVTAAGPMTVSGSSTLQQVAINGSLSFGSTTRQMLNLYGEGYALGVQRNTLYFRTGIGDPDTGFAWFRGGSHSNAVRNPGPDGTPMMTLSSEGLRVGAGGGTLLLGEPGNLSNPAIRFVRGANQPANDVALINDRAGNLHLAGNGSLSGSLSFGATTRQMLNLWGTEYGVGVQSGSTYFRSGADFMWFRRGQHSDAQGDPGTGGERLMRLTTAGRLGLGVESPAYPLDIQASSAVARLVTTNGGFGSVLVLQNRTSATSRPSMPMASRWPRSRD
jgi:hypothetical protein